LLTPRLKEHQINAVDLDKALGEPLNGSLILCENEKEAEADELSQV
jgi:hypothetical protein